MSLFLCHECFSWVKPDGERCPSCWQTLDAEAPDPTLEHLASVMGEVVSCLGEIAIDRPRLSQQGMLYATTHGLYFLPHKTTYHTELVESRINGPSFLWIVASVIWSPLMFVLPFIKRKGPLVEQKMPISKPRFLSAIDSSRLPGILMENPGVFFVPRKDIRQIDRKRQRWTIERRLGPHLTLKPHSDRKRFHQKMSELMTSENWTHSTTTF